MKETKEHLSFDCPYCSKLITFNDEGEPIAEHIEPIPVGKHKGLGGLVSTDASKDWRQTKYQTPSNYKPPTKSLGTLPDINQVEEIVPFPDTPLTDDEVDKALVADIRHMGLVPDTHPSLPNPNKTN